MASLETVAFGPFRLNPAKRLLERAGEPVAVGSRALDLLIALVARPGEVLSQRELVAYAWRGLVVDDANLRVSIAGLRKMLGDGQDGVRYIVNVPGRGYSFVAPLDRHDASSPEVIAGNPPRQSARLPARLARIVGRDQVVAGLVELLQEHRFVSIVGTGGLGKTTVAIEVAHAMLGEFAGAAYFVDMGELADPGLVASAVMVAMGVVSHAESPLPGLLRLLADRHMLLVLDSCELVIGAVAALAERIREAAPQVHLLTTSREALRSEGEYVHILAPLAAPPNEAFGAAEALSFPAMQLFMDRAKAGGSTLVLADAQTAVVADICRRLDGIPLAIELAASRVGTHGLAETAKLLDSRFTLFWQGRRTALPRHQTLQAMHDWSFNLLGERDKAALRRLSVFIGPFTPWAAREVVADELLNESAVDEAITSLVAKSLIWTTTVGNETYLRLLDTTRAYAAVKLAQAADGPSPSRRHGLHYVALMHSAYEDHGSGAATDLSRLAYQINNIRAALAWGFGPTGDLAIAGELAARSARLFLSLSLLTECRRWCEQGLAALGTDPARGLARLSLHEALAISTMFTRHNDAQVQDTIEQGLRLAEQLGRRWHQMHLLTGLHVFLTRIGDYVGAVEIAERSIKVAEEIGIPGSTVVSETMLGAAYHLVGDQVRAQRHYGVAVARAAGLDASAVEFFGHDQRMRALYGLARVSWLRGAVDQAAQLARQGIEQAECKGNPVSLCIALLYGSTVFIWRGDLAEAAGYLERSQAHAARHSLAAFHALGLALSGELAALGGQAQSGVSLLRQGLAALDAQRHRLLTPSLERALAEAYVQCGEIAEGVATINAALARARSRGKTFDMPELLRAQALIGLSSGQMTVDEAARILRNSIQVARDQSSLSFELRSTVALSRLLRSSPDRTDEARSMLEGVCCRFSEGGDTQDLRRAQELLANWEAG